MTLIYRYFQDSLGLPGAMPANANIPYYGNSESQSIVNHQTDRNHSLDLTLKLGRNDESDLDRLSGEFNIFYDRKKLDYLGRSAYIIPPDSFDISARDEIIGRNSGVTARLRQQFGHFNISGGLEYLSGSSAYDTQNRQLSIADSQITPAVSYDRTYRKQFRDTYAFWSAGRFDANKILSLDLSGRLELINGHKLYDSYNSGIRFAPDGFIAAKLAYGVAYRLPSFNDLYWPVDPYSAGNPVLVPEKGQNVIFTLSTDTKSKVSGGANLFYKRVKDLIAWAPVGQINAWGSPRWTPSNLNIFESRGVDHKSGL